MDISVERLLEELDKNMYKGEFWEIKDLCLTKS